MFELKDVSKIYKKRRKIKYALDNVSLKLPDKGFVFIVGKSGSGKSTLINIISGLDSYSKGEVIYNNKSYSTLSFTDFDILHHNEFGFVFQDYCLIENATVEDNIALGALQNHKKLDKEIHEILVKVDLKNSEKKLVKQLSGGQKQRVSLARALIKHPKVVFCDEPTGNLDFRSSIKVLNILKEISKEKLVVIVSHNEENAYEYGTRIIQLNEGKIIGDKSLSPSAQSHDLYEISSSFYANEDEINKFNTLYDNKTVTGLTSKYSNFIPTDESLIKENDTPLNKKSVFAAHKTLFKIFNRKNIKKIGYSLFTALLLSLFAVSYQIGNFNCAKDMGNHYSANPNLFRIDKVCNTSAPTYYNKILEEDIEAINSLNPGTYFKQYHNDLMLSKLKSGEVLYNNTHPTHNDLHLFYRRKINGILATNKDYISKLLEVDELEITPNPNGEKPTGIYVADYVFDSFKYFQNSNKNENDFFNYNFCPSPRLNFKSAYINGIIKTNYKEKYKELKDKVPFPESERAKFINLPENFKPIEELLYIYNVAYSFNSDFENDYLSSLDAQESIYLNTLILSEDVENEGKAEKLYQSYVTYDENLKDDEVIINETYFVNYKDHKNNIPAFENYLNDFKNINIVNFVDGSTVDNTNVEPILNDKFKKVHLLSNYLKNHQLTNPKSASIFVSKNLYKKIKKHNFFNYSLYFENPKKAKIVTSIFDSNKFTFVGRPYQNSIIFSKNVEPFKKLFKVFAYFVSLAIIVVILFYSIYSIKSEKYTIGVVKSLGTRTTDICASYAFQLMLFFLETGVTFALFYYLILTLINYISLTMFSTNFTNYLLILKTAFNFKPLLFASLLGVLFICCLLSNLFDLLILSRIKPIKIIKNNKD